MMLSNIHTLHVYVSYAFVDLSWTRSNGHGNIEAQGGDELCSGPGVGSTKYRCAEATLPQQNNYACLHVTCCVVTIVRKGHPIYVFCA